MSNLVQRPDGQWAEQPPVGCPQCELAWPFDGTPNRVQVGSAVGGGRTYRCDGCGYVTGSDAPYRIGMAPDGEMGA